MAHPMTSPSDIVERLRKGRLDPAAKGRPLNSMKPVECGIYCEEPTRARSLQEPSHD